MALVRKQGLNNVSASSKSDYYKSIYEKLESGSDIATSVKASGSPCVNNKLIGLVDNYLANHYIPTHQTVQNNTIFTDKGTPRAASSNYGALPNGASLGEIMEKLKEPFALTLVRTIEEKGYTSVDIYKRANIDRKLFSKIMTDKKYRPSKKIVLALAIALELNYTEAEEFLRRAGFAFSPSQKFDLIVEYFIINKQYDIKEINETLYHYEQPLLGG